MIARFDAAVQKVGEQTRQKVSAEDVIEPILEEAPLKTQFEQLRERLEQKA